MVCATKYYNLLVNDVLQACGDSRSAKRKRCETSYTFSRPKFEFHPTKINLVGRYKMAILYVLLDRSTT